MKEVVLQFLRRRAWVLLTLGLVLFAGYKTYDSGHKEAGPKDTINLEEAGGLIRSEVRQTSLVERGSCWLWTDMRAERFQNAMDPGPSSNVHFVTSNIKIGSEARTSDVNSPPR